MFATEIFYNLDGSVRKTQDPWNRKDILWTLRGQIRTICQNSVCDANSEYDAGMQRRVFKAASGDNWEHAMFPTGELTVRNGNEVTTHVNVGDSRIASRTVEVTDINDGSVSPVDVSWFSYDERGSTGIVSDELGIVSNRYFHLPTGEVWGSSGKRDNFLGPSFTGKELELRTGLYNFGARHYDPKIGIWMRPDPALPDFFTSGLAGGMQNPANFGVYTYAWNNPVGFIDPDGRAPKKTSWTKPGWERTPEDVQNELKQLSNIPFLGVGFSVVRFLYSAAAGDKKEMYSSAVDVGKDVGISLALGGAGKIAGKLLRRWKAAKIARSRKPSAVCFLGGTEVETASGSKPIENIQVGQRVITLGEITSEESAVDQATWKLIRLEMQNPDGSGDVLDIEMLRSSEWVSLRNALVGQEIRLELEDMALAGLARVVDVEPCPDIEEGPGRVVLSTVTHFNGNLWEIAFEGTYEVLEPTGRHRLFSEDRKAWVRTQELVAGESLRTKHGTAVIARIQRTPGVHRVYNLEVETEHSYLASELGVLSHNTNDCGRVLPGPFFKTAAEARKAAEKLGFKLVKGRLSSGQQVFKKKNLYITRDATGHINGAFKMADKVKKLHLKETRMGTYDANLNRIGD